jgi:isoleucyl-tRNA synthetase
VQREEFMRLGVEGDWDSYYTTMSFDAEAAIARELLKLAMSGQLYRGSKPVMWSVVEKTALAEAEVEYEDYTSDTVWVKFPIVEPIVVASKSDASMKSGASGALVRDAAVVIWTTTPWTIPGNRAVSYSSRISYGLYEVTQAPADNWAKAGDKLILADKLAPEVMKSARVEAYGRRGDVKPSTIKALTHPLRGKGYDFIVPLLDGLATAATTSISGPRTRAHCRRAASIRPSPTPSTRTASSPRTRRASRASASSTTRARKATPTTR